MMNSVRLSLILYVLIFYTIACSDKNNNGPVKPQTLEWSIDNGATQSAETITFIKINNKNYINAIKGTTNIFLSTTSTAPGTYTLATTSADMGLSIAGKQYENLGCDIIISSNSNSLLKGTFNGTFGLVNVDTVSISGTFEDVVYY